MLFMKCAACTIDLTGTGKHHPDGPEIDHALTFNLDHSMGQSRLLRPAQSKKTTHGPRCRDLPVNA
jgi:hypothetical protein